MSTTKSDQKQKFKRFCGHCRNHGFKFEIRGHKLNCRYKFCVCEKCKIQEYANLLSVGERKCQRGQERSKNVQMIPKVEQFSEVFSGNCEITEKISNDDQSSSTLGSQIDSKDKNVYEFCDDDKQFGEKLPPFESLKKFNSSENDGKIEDLPSFCGNFGKFLNNF